MYSALERVSSPVVILDSEMCHCGGATGPGRWTASCTVQLCSSTGWKPLQQRTSEKLLEYTCPIDCAAGGPWIELPVESQIQPLSAWYEEEQCHFRAGGECEWSIGTQVEAMCNGIWLEATIRKRNPTTTYRLQRRDDNTFIDEIPLTSIRPRRWTEGTCIEATWYGDWYPATVARVRSDWSYRVHWEDGETCSHTIYHRYTRPRKGCEESVRQSNDARCKHDYGEASKRLQCGRKRSLSEASTADTSSSPSRTKRCI